MAFTPVLKIGSHWKEPTHGGFQLDLTGEEMLRQARVAPGVLRRLSLNPLSKETQFIEDPLVGQIPFRPREISPEYTFRWLNTANKGEMAWLQIPGAEEVAQRRIARTGTLLMLTELCEKSGRSVAEIRSLSASLREVEATAAKTVWDTTLAKLKPDERKAVAGLIIQLDELEDRGTGFLETVPNFYQTGASGVRWNFAVPNVPVRLVSSWTLQGDQKQCLRIKRLSPLPQQVKPAFKVYAGNEKTLYCLVFSKDESVEFRHFRNLPAAQRASLEAEWERVLAEGYLTPADKLQIATWQAQIDLLKKASSAIGNGTSGGAEGVQILDLKDKIKALKESKAGLTDAMRTRADALKEKLFYQVVPITLAEDTRSLFDTDFNITLGFHRRGFVSIRLGLGADVGKEVYYYEIEGITKNNRPATILPAGSRLMIESNGGPFGVVYGVADHAERAVMATQPFEIPFQFNDADWRVNLDAVGVKEDAASEPLQVLARCRIVPRVELVKAGAANNNGTMRINPQVRVVLEFQSDANPNRGTPWYQNHDYGAELYRATAICLAGEPFDSSQIVWDSRDFWPIEDVQLQSDPDGGSAHMLYLNDAPRRDLKLPTDLQNRWCELGFIDTRDGATHGQYFPIVRGGSIEKPSRDRLRRAFKNGRFEVLPRLDGEAAFMVRGMEAWLDRPIEIPLAGNGLPPNEYIYQLCALHGAPEELLQGIPRGDLPGLERLDAARIGSPPDIKPNVGDPLLSFIRDEITLKHCYGWRLRFSPLQGIVFERAVWRDCTDVNYQSTLPTRAHLAIHDTPKIWQDVSRYWSEAVFLGAWNPGTGKRHRADYRIWEATHRPGSAYYVGERKRYLARPDDSLKYRHRCARACRSFQDQFGLPPWFTMWEAWFDLDRRTGDLIRIDGVRVVVDELSYTRFGVGAKQMMTITARLFDDVTVPYPAVVV